ncbi:endonuclease VII domain-containing protein [Blastococcus sp. KM273129]|uniref:endonuclease VII domain-containing protein n=1 Tax=Blastococcus sp. KM273129 TaxID=2570315 RepID=UPI0021076DD6|nr:endonuclease VII domain-containing protein [Blastococcus sp. KM273129]
MSRRHGTTAPEADLMLESQGGVCAICRTASPTHVEHDHATGAVRALLCFTCNGGLGQFRDDPVLLHMAAFHVEHHEQQQAMALLQEAITEDPDGRADVSGRR